MNNEAMIHWWQGYVIIIIRGERLERLINRMMNARLAAWDLIRLDNDRARVAITVKDFMRLRLFLKETGCRVRIEHKIGLPFWLTKIRRRSGFVAGLFLFLGFLYMLSMMIWTVEIEGVQLPEDEAVVRETLADLGVQPWTFKFQVEKPDEIKRKVMEKLPGVTWVGFEYEGTKARLRVVEKTVPDLPEQTSNRHLVAKKKAIIHDIFVERGQPLVEPSQYVEEGDILISGNIGQDEQPEQVPAKGEVWGEVWYETEIELPLQRKRSVLTGEHERRYRLNIGPLSIPIWGWGKVPFAEYIISHDHYHFSLKDWTLPISWTTEIIAARREAEQTLTVEEALKEASHLARRKLRSQIDEEARIEDENILKKEWDNDKVYMKMHYTVIEEISSEQFIYRGD